MLSRSKSFRVGDSRADDLHFQVDQDPAVAGREVEIYFGEEGWRIRSLGSRAALINHSPIESEQPLRSGDIVRLSEDGPDFSFSVLKELPLGARLGTAGSLPAPAVPAAAATAGPQPAAESSQPPVAAAETEQSETAELVPTAEVAENPAARVAMWAMVAVIVMVVAITVWRSRSEVPLSFHPVPAQTIDEGQRLVVSPRVAAPVEGLKFQFEGVIPEGVDIDPDAGTITWIPNADQAAKYTLAVSVTDADGKRRGETVVVVDVRDVNLRPTIDPVPDPKVDPRQQKIFAQEIVARDPEGEPLEFRLGAGAPAGMQIDDAGHITWTPGADDQGKSYDVQVIVSDGEQEGSTSFKVTVVKSGPWDLAFERTAPGVYLLVLEDPKGQVTFPFGTASAIQPNRLLSTASVAVELEPKRREGWKVWAIRPADQSRELVTKIQVAKFYNVPDAKRDERVYLDFALFHVDAQLDPLCTLANDKSLAELEKGQKIACVGITHEAKPLDRFANIEPGLYEGSIFVITNLSQEPDVAAPRLLHIRAAEAWPGHLFGSPIVNESGEIVALYSDAAKFPEGDPLKSLNIYYAPVSTLAAALVSGVGQEEWEDVQIPAAKEPDAGEAPAATNPTPP